jgi:NAD(P)-dependent dehydrogenase (short-subunit alcohol dehydrogenase family)
MTRLCEGRVAIVTGGGRGLGRAHALALAAQGARVVVNDLGGAVDGTGSSAGPADAVVEEIQGAGGVAVPNADDCADWDGARRIVQTAIDAFGRLDVLVANAGILRDRTLVNMTADDWDGVMRVHLRGTFCTAHWAAVHWRDRSKAGETVDARLICTSSASGLYGNIGQANYGAAKAGIATFATVAAAELGRYGVTANACSGGPHPDDGGPLPGRDAAAGAGIRRHGARERVARRGLAREPGVEGGHRARVRGDGRPGRHRRGLAPRPL